MITSARRGTHRFQPAASKAERAVESRRQALHDTGLIERFNGGDESAFAEIQTYYRPRIASLAFGFLKNRADADEIAQETFIRAYRGLAKFRGESSLKTWLYRITTNLSRNRYWYFFRRHRHATVSFDQAVGEEGRLTLGDVVGDGAADPARVLELEDYGRVVQTCMEQLEGQARELLHLRNAKRHSYVEIALKLGINIGTVKSRIARAREKLRLRVAEATDGASLGVQQMESLGMDRPVHGLSTTAA